MVQQAGSSNSEATDAGGAYVLDNMEGAADRAAFLAGTDLPVAIVGPRGTGKMYLARLLHREAGFHPDELEYLDCRSFRNRDQAVECIDRALAQCEGKTLVFKYPHLMAIDAQLRLARQIASRRLLDHSPPQAMGSCRLVALFPDRLQELVRQQQLQERLASVFAGYPIDVPPLRARRRAVLRWADKILEQESPGRDSEPLRFSPEARQAMLDHEWEGNISELRQRVVRAVAATSGSWLSPADLGLYASAALDAEAQLAERHTGDVQRQESYTPGPRECLEQGLAEAVHHVLALDAEIPLGLWLRDSIILILLEEAQQPARAAKRLQTSSRNVQRWAAGLGQRRQDRQQSQLWKPLDERLRAWLQALQPEAGPPLALAQTLLLKQLELQGMDVSVKVRAAILGVSPPTYHKKLAALRETTQEA